MDAVSRGMWPGAGRGGAKVLARFVSGLLGTDSEADNEYARGKKKWSQLNGQGVAGTPTSTVVA